MTSRRHVTGFSEVLDWRPIDFVDLPSVRSCHLCGVVPSVTFITECCHVFCHSCYQSILRRGQRCPQDDRYFDEREVQVRAFRQRQLEEMKARCCNWSNGCDFVGTTKQVLDHFFSTCTYHTVACPKCGTAVLRRDILEHFTERCAPLPQQGRTDFAEDILSVSKNIEAALSEIAQEQAQIKNSLNRMALDSRAMEDKMDSTLDVVRLDLEDILARQRADSQQSLILSVQEKIEDMHTRLQSGNFVDLDTSVLPGATARTDTPGISSGECSEDMLDNRCNNLISFASAVLGIEKGLTSIENRLSELLSSTQLNRASFHVRDFAALRTQAKTQGRCHRESEPMVLGGYAVKLTLSLTMEKCVLYLGVYFGICRSSCDARLRWPFQKPFTLVLVHPNDDEKNLERAVTEEKVRERASTNFSRPSTVANTGYGFRKFASVDDVEKDGFVFEDAVCIAVQLD